MAVHSVIRCEVLCDRLCHKTIHPWTPYCLVFLLRCMQKTALGSISIFGVFNGIRLAPKIKNNGFQFEEIMKTIKEILQSCLFTTFLIPVSLSFTCVFRSILGRYTNYTTAFAPTLVGTISILLEHPDKWNLIMFMTGNTIMEYILRAGTRSWGISLQPRALALYFMVTSAILLRLLRRPDVRSLLKPGDSAWFFFPTISKAKGEDNDSSNHRKAVYFIKHAVQQLARGVGLQVIQLIVKNLGKPAIILRKLFRLNTYRLGLFLGCYPTLFKVTCTLLQHVYKSEEGWHTIVAGFCAGVSLIIYPDVFLAVMATTTLCQILAKVFCKEIAITNKRQLKFPFALTFIATCVHIYFSDPDCCSKWFSSILDSLSCGTSAELRLRLLQIWHAARFPVVVGGINVI